MNADGLPLVPFGELMRPNRRPYELGADEDADLVGMRLYGYGPFHRERKLAARIRKKSHFVIRKNDVIYNKLFAWKGAFGIVPAELDGMFVSDKFPTYELDTSRVDRNYLQWYFRYPSLWEQAKRMSTGSAALSKLTLNPPRFLELRLPTPPLAVQRRVAEKLNRIAELDNEVKELCGTSRDRYEACFLSFMDKLFGELNDAYPACELISLVDDTRGISYGVVQTGKHIDDGVPTLRAGDLRRFEVRHDAIKRIAPEIAARYRRTQLRGNEVLLRIRGGLGEVAVCPSDLVGGNVSREIAVIPVTDDLVPEYVMFAVARPSSQEFLRRHLRGTSYVGINLSDVRKLTIPVPPRHRQVDVVVQLRKFRLRLAEIEEAHAGVTDEVNSLLPSILDRAFRGEL